ncbi:hypothetical protein LB941_08825 [Ligilactobacillus sp. WILCCON 0076]|uniref:Uncharacterized protein n=1 Tax=Ligilactobacillus ubinensis TaxID=2876789 RepID=A0A9X2FP03_9LACO|nr:hypothetical protein [Ligilactobacillus ubinensis]MCP0887438.1 hypothetical protein [Ligilactobacillus ubinensis]
MGLFINQTDFKEYLLHQYPELDYDASRVLVAISTVKANPIINCLYVTDNFFFAARYHSAMAFFSDGLSLKQTEIVKMYLIDKWLSTNLVIETNIMLKTGDKLVLKMNLPKLNRTPWHVHNLKLLRQRLPLQK